MILGIDLGTTNSAAGVWRNGRAELIPNSLGHLLTPSAVSIDDDGKILVGLAARDRQVTHPERTATAFKRYMGTSRSLSLGQTRYYPEELSAFVLRSLKADAEHYLGETITDAVITVPAYFNDKQRKATKRAGELAGLRVERLLNEPTAAALAYGIHETGRETRFLVFDLGGGTFDVSVLDIFDGVIEVRASTGDNRLGGEDFNEVLIRMMLESCRQQWHLPDTPRSELLYQRVRAEAERARRLLSSEEQTTMSISWNDKHAEHLVSTEQFERAAETLLQRLRVPVVRALKDGGIDASQLDSIVLVGGATRMPIVRRAVTRMFGRFPDSRLNPDEAVALGAAVQAGLKQRDAALNEIVLTDVCPYTLGIEISEVVAGVGLRGGLFAPLIERNTIVPASRSKQFSTLTDGQTFVHVNVYQGEARQVSDNVKLGELKVPVPPRRAGEVNIDCRFSYDVSGLLEIDVHVPLTDERHQLVILDDEDGTQREEVQQRRERLAALKIHPRDQDANRVALSRAARCFEESLGERRELVGRWMSQFEAVLERQDPREIEMARNAFMKALDGVDGEVFL
ncbi:Hsp70 family protein [Peristeroidobacter agariperforans]|uniref:Hsp70 family protein n=1 Tax=Peristeroidobacter agariperforans TaxID=268404 RepID=UPI00101C0C7E